MSKLVVLTVAEGDIGDGFPVMLLASCHQRPKLLKIIVSGN
jgi:hypothetical protein